MEDLKKIIELCDISWIQERWEPENGDWVCHKDLKYKVSPITDVRCLVKDSFIWLPLSFNPETCRNQLDDLLMEAGKFTDEGWCSNWIVKKTKKGNGEIIAKLTYLHELIKEAQ